LLDEDLIVPTHVALSQRSSGQVFNYGDPALQLSEGHPVVYTTKDSHGLYPGAARHTCKSLGNDDSLHDDTSAAPLWGTQAAVVTLSPQAQPQTGSLSWLNYSGCWGNPKSGCDVSE
jgi:hypothetical protein